MRSGLVQELTNVAPRRSELRKVTVDVRTLLASSSPQFEAS